MIQDDEMIQLNKFVIIVFKTTGNKIYSQYNDYNVRNEQNQQLQ
jgi:hypothetical protein